MLCPESTCYLSHYVSSSIHDNDPEILESEKQRNLKGEQYKTSSPHKHAPGWNEYLASTSEAYTKADKSTATVEEMQQETLTRVEARHPKTVVEAVAEKVTDALEGAKEVATEAKDTIMGPLASAGKTLTGSDDASSKETKKKKY
ncbi:hypothetical protein CPB86DRAFT_693767 [Serendipita vermifera]|nr:hypothetical protein CPB86DRAFT_693767 [Serendipita vermifera]